MKQISEIGHRFKIIDALSLPCEVHSGECLQNRRISVAQNKAAVMSPFCRLCNSDCVMSIMRLFTCQHRAGILSRLIVSRRKKRFTKID